MNQTTHQDDDAVNLAELFYSLLYQWKFITLCILVSLSCAFLYLRIASPKYSSDALVQVIDQKSISDSLFGDLSKVLDTKSQAQTEIELLHSRLVIGNTVKNLHLDIAIHSASDTILNRLLKNNKIKTYYRVQDVSLSENGHLLQISNFEVPSFYQDQPIKLHILPDGHYSLTFLDKAALQGTLNTPLQATLGGEPFSLTLKIQPGMAQSDFTLTKYSLQNAVSTVDKNFRAQENGKQTGIISLNYEGIDSDHISRVLNEILNQYLNQNIAQRTAEAEQTIGFLKVQLPELKKQLEESEIKFNAFRKKNNTIDIDKESELLLGQSIALKNSKTELELKKAELTSKYTTQHPMLAEIDSQLAEVDSKTTQLNDSLSRLPEIQRQYLQSYRDVQVNTALYTELLDNYQQMKVAKAGQVGTVRVVDSAITTVNPIKPKKMLVIILALITGAAIGIVIALLRKTLRIGIKNTELIEERLDLPVYATVPRSIVQSAFSRNKQRKMNLLAAQNSDDIAIESLRSIRTVLYFTQRNAKNNITLVAGPAPGVGKSFISANLATVLAQSGKSVLLIDGDMRRGHLHKYMTAKKNPGLADYLNDLSLSIDDICQMHAVTGLNFISRGEVPRIPAEMLNSSRFAELLTALSARYDHVIIDSPPILAVTDSAIIGRHAGTCLLVARYAVTHIKELELSIRRLDQAGVHVNGIVLNDILREASGAYGYGYNYNYKYTSNKR